MIRIPEAILAVIRKLAEENPHIETCGYLAGNGEEVKEIFPMTNMDQSPEHFTFVPEEQFSVLDKAGEAGLELIGVYHSHPASPARMSVEDIRLAYDTSVFYLVYSLLTKELKAFRVDREKGVTEVPAEIIPEGR